MRDPVKLLEEFEFSNWQVAGTDIYVGYEHRDGSWVIQHFDTGTGSVEFARGSNGYAVAWTAAALQSYGSYSEVF